MKPRQRRAFGLTVALVIVAAVAVILVGTAAAETTSYDKTPGATKAQMQASIFYIAVDYGTNGTGDRLYYYFSLDELKQKYGVETRDFNYTNHTVGTTTSAHGFSITTLLDSLVDDCGGDHLNLPESWIIQYLEDDAYHATGASYKDTIEAARNTTKPMLTYEIKSTYVTPTKYNVNDTAYKWAEDLYPEYLRVYRQTDSANSAVMKMMMGIVVSSDGLAFNKDTAGAYNLKGTDAAGTEVVMNSKGKPGRIVYGVLANMKIGVQPPTVPAYTPNEACQVITVEPKATFTQTVLFTYGQAADYLYAKDCVAHKAARYTQSQVANAGGNWQAPLDLATVQGLVASGQAAEVTAASIDPATAEFTIPIPTRKLFVDTRESSTPYGYTDLNLYRYFGNYAAEFAGVAHASATNIVATDTEGAMSLLTGTDAVNAFIAYKDSHSKACPNNTAEGKRFTWVYNHPKLIDEYDGDVLVTSLARIDVNAPLVTALKVTTYKHKSSKIKKGKNVLLVAKTTPTRTVEKITWASSNKKVATVNSKGRVFGKKRGKVTITATSTFGKTATIRIRVK